MYDKIHYKKKKKKDIPKKKKRVQRDPKTKINENAGLGHGMKYISYSKLNRTKIH